jgi:copper chaperone CopZ
MPTNQTMKNIILILIALVLPNLASADKVSLYVYEGQVAGVMCSACSGRVQAALGHLEGVKEVKITLGKEGGAPRLRVISTSPNLTQEAAVKALGEDAKMYHISGFKRGNS